MPRCAGSRARTCSASPSRSRPLSTKTQVSWSPIARWISAAATDESTPPERRADHAAVADLRADVARSPSSMNEPARPVAAGSRRRRTGSSRRISAPCGVCTTSGWNWRPKQPRRRPPCGERRVAERRKRLEAGRQPLDAVAVAHPDVERRRAGRGRAATSLVDARARAGPYSRSLPGGDAGRRAGGPGAACRSRCRGPAGRDSKTQSRHRAARPRRRRWPGRRRG